MATFTRLLPRSRDGLASRSPLLLETWILHELRSAIAYKGLRGELRYWRTTSGSEIDFIRTRARRAVGIEVKAATQWRREFGGSLESLMEDRIVQAGFGVYTRAVELKGGLVRVLPRGKFLTELAAGRVLH
jgi:predicted AAA+ superfamily ATPase